MNDFLLSDDVIFDAFSECAHFIHSLNLDCKVHVDFLHKKKRLTDDDVYTIAGETQRNKVKKLS